MGGFVGEICENGRFMSPTWETSSKREIGQKRGSFPPKVGGLTFICLVCFHHRLCVSVIYRTGTSTYRCLQEPPTNTRRGVIL